MTKYHKPKDIAKLFLISNTKIYELIHSGEIGSIRIAGSYRISDHHLENYIKKNSYRAKARRPF